MKNCKKCFQPDTRPGIYFSESQICSGCLYEDSKKIIETGDNSYIGDVYPHYHSHNKNESSFFLAQINEYWQKGKLVLQNDLPKYSSWPERMLGIKKWVRDKRSSIDLEREFEKETYAPMYQKLLENSQLSNPYEFTNDFYGVNDTVCYMNNEFRIISTTDAQKIDALWVKYFIAKLQQDVKSIIDIGAGTGSLIIDIVQSFDIQNCLALEKMSSARKIIELFAQRNNLKIQVDECDILEAYFTPVIYTHYVKPVIYTHYVTHYVTSENNIESNIIKRICEAKPSLVLHFEPFMSQYDTNTLHGQLCAAYLKINKYNQTFDKQLHAENGKSIDIVLEVPNIFGRNPYLPKSLIAWKPR